MLYEVVTGQILLSRRKQFFDLHQNVLLPIMQKIGIRPKLLLITEIGRHGRFLDIYEYKDFADYENLTNQLIEHPDLQEYYDKIATCIDGSIQVELMKEMPYAHKFE